MFGSADPRRHRAWLARRSHLATIPIDYGYGMGRSLNRPQAVDSMLDQLVVGDRVEGEATEPLAASGAEIIAGSPRGV